MTWTSTDVETLFTTSNVTRHRPHPTRHACVEFRAGRSRYWALIAATVPVPHTWADAEAATRGNSICLDAHPPRSWDIIAVVDRIRQPQEREDE